MGGAGGAGGGEEIEDETDRVRPRTSGPASSKRAPEAVWGGSTDAGLRWVIGLAAAEAVFGHWSVLYCILLVRSGSLRFDPRSHSRSHSHLASLCPIPSRRRLSVLSVSHFTSQFTGWFLVPVLGFGFGFVASRLKVWTLVTWYDFLEASKQIDLSISWDYWRVLIGEATGSQPMFDGFFPVFTGS
ncbi:hypothetical protein I7I51_02623 [Histoplasma capsulatum]|uniref:Uncharacterized protein n=1 Tax=Ajellomyces capsulatus TaxID=5037 RepID=A0A8A1MCF1_AJECA|nr:hypothetical protein I7I51_02623 [Histoplasma capsulatum]